MYRQFLLSSKAAVTRKALVTLVGSMGSPVPLEMTFRSHSESTFWTDLSWVGGPRGRFLSLSINNKNIFTPIHGRDGNNDGVQLHAGIFVQLDVTTLVTTLISCSIFFI